MKSRAWVAGVIGTLVIVGTTVATQNQPGPNQPGQNQPAAGAAKSVGRGWPLAGEPRNFQAVGPGGGGFGGFPGGAQGGGAPPGGAPGAPAGGARGAAPGAPAAAPGAAPAPAAPQGGRGAGAPGGAPGGRGAGAPAGAQAGAPAGGGGRRGGGAFNGSARNGAVPEGIQALKVDLFTSKDFYKDKELWKDKRYFRCNSSAAAENQWGGGGGQLIGDNPPATAAWGYCDRDMPREALVSPYPFKTAQAHYDALMAETKAKGGPTQHTYATVPGEWTGRYGGSSETWFYMGKLQIPTVLSLLTPEYQKRFVQEIYHQGNSNVAHWPSQYCWPEGFMRRFHQAAVRDHHVMVTPQLVQIMAGVADNFVTNIYVGRQFNLSGAVPRLGADVPRWYGETIGFWDGDALITWSSNIQGWMTHSAFEHSSKLQTVEIYTPNRDASGRFLGLNHEAIFYDPEALVEPTRIVRTFTKQSNPDQGDPYMFIECVQTIYPVNGKATPLSPGATFQYEVPDMYGRPWAQMWEKYNEKNMEKPVNEDLFDFSNNKK